MREIGIEIEVVSYAESQGWMVRKVAYLGRRGAPDRWFFAPGGRLVMVEFKRPGEEPDLIQAREIARLIALGFEVHVIDDIESGKELFNR